MKAAQVASLVLVVTCIAALRTVELISPTEVVLAHPRSVPGKAPAGLPILPNATSATGGGYVNGSMVRTYELIDHSFQMLMLTSASYDHLESLGNLYQARIVQVNDSTDFLAQLNSSHMVYVPETQGTPLEEQISLVAETLLSWTARGNLLLLSDFTCLVPTFAAVLGIDSIELFASDSPSVHIVELEPSSPLTHNLASSRMAVMNASGGFRLAVPSNATIAAWFLDENLSSILPAALISEVGTGYCLTFGFDVIPTMNGQLGGVLSGLLGNMVSTYGSVHISLNSKAFPPDDPVSPDVHPLASDDPIFERISDAANSVHELGFTVLHSNLLYSDGRGRYFSRLSLHGPRSRFIEVFHSQVTVTYSEAPTVLLSQDYRIPSCVGDLFCEVAPIPFVTLLQWPPGWAPPQVGYYHLSPIEAARQDMGATFSVEKILEVDRAFAAYGLDGAGVTVAMIDSGFSRNATLYPTPHGFHPYYENYYEDLLEYRFESFGVAGTNPDVDAIGHGTAIACNLFAVAPGITFRFINCGAGTAFQDIFAALDRALQLNPDVLTCSWEISQKNNTILAQIRQLARNGVIVLFAAGNGGIVGWPAIEQCVVTVGGAYVTETGLLEASSYASSGDSTESLYNNYQVYPPGRRVPDVCGIVGQAPNGTLIEMPTQPASENDVDCSTAPDGTAANDGWLVASGTSSAAPQVAGLAALMKQREPTINVDRFRHIAMTTCTDVVTGQSAHYEPAGNGFDAATGAGLINVYRALWACELEAEYVPRTLPTGKSVHFYNFTGPYGLSYHIDTSGTSQYGFNFFGFLADRDGAVMTHQYSSSGGLWVKGWFRQCDTFPQNLRPGRRHLHLYVLPVDGSKILASTELLGSGDGTDWKYVDKHIAGSSIPWGMVRIGIGRDDGWSTDWQLTAEWAQAEIQPYDWTPRTIPSGKHYNFFDFGSSMGDVFHIDTSGSAQYSYHFCAGAQDALFWNYGGQQKLSVAGWFRQDDGFYPSLQPGRRYLNLYLLTPDGTWILATCRLLEWYDGNDWVFRRIVVFTTSLPTGWVLVAVGRYDDWEGDWSLTAEWCNLQITTWI